MSEFSLSCTNGKNKTEYLSSLILSDFMLFSSFILSHPLYFSYFIFFSPYLFKILSFLSPLFATTSLLLLALFTLTPTLVIHGSHLQLPKSNPSFLLTTYQTLVETLRSEETGQDHELSCFQLLEVFKMVFENSDIEIQHDAVEDPCEMEPDQSIRPPEPVKDHSKPPEAKQVKNLVAFFQEKEKLESFSGKKGEKEVKQTNTVTDKGDQQKEEFKAFRGSKALGGEKVGEARSFTDDPRNRLRSAGSWGSENGEELKQKFNKFTENYSQPLESYSYSPNLGNFGSMRRVDKEWKRTLACKLFEERNNNNGEGGEGMDLLWETYETETTNKSHPAQLKSGSKKGKKNREINYNDQQSDYSGNLGDEDYDEDSAEPLCCLQALKFSAGKMNLGMGRPNLVKISKALKGLGWLHHVGSRHGKKSYHH